jgi:pyruvate,water dikinase
MTTWQPPAGGQWELETVHVQGWQPRVFQECAPEAFKVGFQRCAERYGLPIDYLDMRFVNDHCYARMRPLGAPEPKPGKPSAAPPLLVMKLLARVHPGLRRREKTARAALAERRWQIDHKRWDTTLRDEMLTTGRALQAEAIERLADDELHGHLRRTVEHFVRGTHLHFELMPVHNIPVGRLVLACRAWGIEDGEALALLAGSSPASAASTTALARIAKACAAAGMEPNSLDDVRAASPVASEVLDAFLADNAWRIVTQYTPRGQALIEVPDLIVRAIRRARIASRPSVAPHASSVRARVPDADRARFDELLDDARACYGNRDDNVALTYMWPVGLLRRALLEIGRRLAEREVIDDPMHALALGSSELVAALAGDTALGDEARVRYDQMERWEAEGAPLRLGESEGELPDMSAFPVAMAEVTEAMMTLFELEGIAIEETAEWSGTGVGIGTESYSARACVAASPEDALARLQAGEVLVTSLTTPAYEAIMPIAGAVVTEHGGLASHTALVAREHGIPAVVGVKGATTAIPDGAHVNVDPASGKVTVSAAVASA